MGGIAQFALTPRTAQDTAPASLLPLSEGRKRYEEYIGRPVVTGGVQPSTKKRYRSVFDKFLPWCSAKGITHWNQLSTTWLTKYADDLENGRVGEEELEYADKSIVNELTTICQTIKWLIGDGHVTMTPPKLSLEKAESQRAYCWRPEEVAAMLAHCRAIPRLHWLADVIVALACTGLRIGELAGLRSTDIDWEAGRLTLTDETGHRRSEKQARRRLKSGRSRSFPIHPDLAEVLKRRCQAAGRLFAGPRGGQLKPDTVRRILVREVITPLEKQFPTKEGERGFKHGRLHSFRHYFASTCANNNVPEQMLMSWLGHQDSEMIRHYYHMHDELARRTMNGIKFLGACTEGPTPAQDAANGKDAKGPSTSAS